MASNALIIAHNNIFNKSILENEAMYFENSSEISILLNSDNYFSLKESYGSLNHIKIQEKYNLLKKKKHEEMQLW